ncbi:hypothetical protein QJS83_14475 [Bdellovibrio sp. 22V]|uniref:hypothetical protein n=1 Tax=Bdellovibrio TaxID=958 RepID=UPI002542D9A6|nr:hypothetical protein [Bdellovibrio sp. 22V]WII71671.1 hypothetical protein QJS83_14475 [Bdellovibrio sp. 22V]
MKIVFHSLALIASVPLIAFAIEPTNPSGFCDRFIGEKDIELCKGRTEKDEVDWYAATICNLQKDDKAFWTCWDSIKGQSFNPQALDACGDSAELSDEQRLSCVQAAKGSRKPASTSQDGLFQPLKSKVRY